MFVVGGEGEEDREGSGKQHNDADYEAFYVPNITKIKSRRLVKGNVTCMEQKRN
jgi:hypothetical protein